MMSSGRRLVPGGWAFLCLMVLAGPCVAQNYPDRPIAVVVPWPGGGAADLVPRLTGEDLTGLLGQPVVMENRPGAAGTLGSAAVARAEPDGYTLLATVNPPITMNLYLQKNFPYDAKTAFTPITLAAYAPLFLAVSTSLPVKTVAELVAYAKQHPGELSYGSAGIGTGHHIVGEWMKKETGIDMIHVPYRGSGPVVQDLISKHIQVGFGSLPGLAPAVELGAVRILAVTGAERFSELPEVPTISETLAPIKFDAWYGLFGPAATPRLIVDRLNKAMATALKNPTSIAKFKTQGVVPAVSTPEELADKVRAEIEMWGKVIPSIGLKPE